MDNEEKLDLIIKLCEADVSMKSRELINSIMKSMTLQETEHIRDMVKERVADSITNDMRSYHYSGQFAANPNFKEQLNVALQTEIKKAIELQKPIIEKAVKDVLPSYLAETNIKAVIKSWAAGLK